MGAKFNERTCYEKIKLLQSSFGVLQGVAGEVREWEGGGKKICLCLNLVYRYERK